MNIRHRVILFFYAPILLVSCAILSHSQLKTINTFAVAAEKYPVFPGDVIKKAQELHFNNNILEASAVSDAALAMLSLRKATAEYDTGIAYSKRINTSLHLIQRYAALLAQLSSDSYYNDFGENTKDLCTNLGSAVDSFNARVAPQLPPSIGGVLVQVVKIAGTGIIRIKQAKALKKLIPVGDTIIQTIKNNLVSVFDGDLKLLLESYRQSFESDFQIIILSNPSRIDYSSLHMYATTISDFAAVESLRQKCTRLVSKMAAAHQEIKESLAKKENLKEMFGATKDFVTDATQ